MPLATKEKTCRALLSPYKDPKTGEFVTWGRFNCGVMSLNLPYIAMENNPDKSEEQLFLNLDKYLGVKKFRYGEYDFPYCQIIDDTYVNLPSHLLPACEEMLHDRLAIDAINQGRCGFRIEKYLQKRYNKECYSVEWVDVLPDKKDTPKEEVPNGEPTQE